MRAWPAKFDGLRLRLSAGWYSIPSYVSADERRLLVAVLVAGIAEIDHVVELDWDVLDECADKLQLTRALVFVRVPADVEPDGEALQHVRATLGSVRLGLLQYEAPGVWADIAWQEREIKAPLLTWLKRWVRDSAHPFAKLGVAGFLIDEIAKLTAEPVELLMMTEMVIRHRLRYRGQGMAREDWQRSIMHVAAERFTRRFMLIPDELHARALDLAMSGGEEPLVAALEDRDAGFALARVGLAWHAGNDLLLGPLVGLVHEPIVLRRLIELLPAEAWSQTGKQRVRRAVQGFLPPPRAALFAPDPTYSAWPAISPQFPITAAHSLDLQDLLNELSSVFWEPYAGLDLHEIRDRILALDDWSPKWRAAFETSFIMLEEIEDVRLLELDFQRGRIHRFDAIDRVWTDRVDGGREACAYFRWLALTRLLGHAHDVQRLTVLADEVDRTLSLLGDSPKDLSAALCSLRGDVWAQQSQCRRALECWDRAEPTVYDGHRYRLVFRRMLALLRLDDFVTAEQIDEEFRGEESIVLGQLLERMFQDLEVPREDCFARYTLRELIQSTRLLGSILDGAVPTKPQTVEALPDSSRARITRIAAALECGDWPHAVNLAKLLESDTNTPEGIRAELLRAWIQAALGDLDRAHASFDELRALALERGDVLAQAFAHRGLAAVAHNREQPEPAMASLEAAVKLERELGLPDAELLEIELIGWRVLAGQLTLSDYNEKLTEFEEAMASNSLKYAQLDACLRFVASSRAVMQTTDVTLLASALHPLIEMLGDGVRLREASPWARPACEVAIGLAARLADADVNEDAQQLLDTARKLAGDDRELLVSIDAVQTKLSA